MEFDIDFADCRDRPVSAAWQTLPMAALSESCGDSRTFCPQGRTWDGDGNAAGLALGGTYENAVVVDGDTVLSPGGLRHEDEAVRPRCWMRLRGSGAGRWRRSWGGPRYKRHPRGSHADQPAFAGGPVRDARRLALCRNAPPSRPRACPVWVVTGADLAHVA